MVPNMVIEAFKYNSQTNELVVLDQTCLPLSTKFKTIASVQDGFEAIRDMLVRGAPCIAAVGCLSLVIEINNKLITGVLESTGDLLALLEEQSKYLISSRPTAVNLQQALVRLGKHALQSQHMYVFMLGSKLTKICCDALERGRVANRRLGRHGVNEFLAVSKSAKLSVLTHCNTGALATVGHGTALGVIRSLHEAGRLEQAYCTETRPYNQGSRLTAWELVQENIPATLIADDMVAYLLASRRIDAIVVGADRVAANGDTANKIGTLQMAVVAKHYGVPFYVAAPFQSIDLQTESAEEIVIEERPGDELRKLAGHQLAPSDVNVWNPCFDVTPGSLIKGIITEFGVSKPSELEDFIRTTRASEGDNEEALF